MNDRVRELARSEPVTSKSTALLNQQRAGAGPKALAPFARDVILKRNGVARLFACCRSVVARRPPGRTPLRRRRPTRRLALHRFPHFVETLHRHRHRRTQLLREQRNPQFLE